MKISRNKGNVRKVSNLSEQQQHVQETWQLLTNFEAKTGKRIRSVSQN